MSVVDFESLNRRVDVAPKSARALAKPQLDRMGVMSEVRLIGGALVTILIVALVLNEVYNAIEIDNQSAWYPIVEDLETTGVAAIGLLIIALLVLAASAILRFMGRSGFGGGR